MDAKSSAFSSFSSAARAIEPQTVPEAAFRSRETAIPDFSDPLLQGFKTPMPTNTLPNDRSSEFFGALATGMLIGAAMLALFATLWFAFVGPSAADIPFEPGIHPTIGDQLERLVDSLYLLGVFVLALAATAAVAGVLAIFSRRVRPYALTLAGVVVLFTAALVWPLAVILILWALTARLQRFRARNGSL